MTNRNTLIASVAIGVAVIATSASAGNWNNSPNNWNNSPNNWNNSPNNWNNSRSNWSATNRIIGEGGDMGYAVTNSDGVTNAFSSSGKRMGFIPAQ